MGKELHIISNLLDRKLTSIAIANGADDVTPVHGMILIYLYRNLNLGRDIYQKDIEAEFDITRSTVASLLKLMEKKGYIRRVGVTHDARLKRIQLTPVGIEAHQRVYSSIQQAEHQIRDALTPEEFQTLMCLLDKIKAVL